MKLLLLTILVFWQINITIQEEKIYIKDNKDALCLDGSTPSFFYEKAAKNVGKYIIFFPQAFWCDRGTTKEESLKRCYEFRDGNLGNSSRQEYFDFIRDLMNQP
jgi:hypothetical protein